MTEGRRGYTVFILGTARVDTVALLINLKSLAIEEVILYNTAGAQQGQLEAEMLCKEFNILSNCGYETSSELPDIQKADIIILWGYCFNDVGAESLIAVKKLLVAVTDEISHLETCPVILFPDGISGIMYANLLNNLISSGEFEEEPVIRVISSISLLSHTVFGPSSEAACAWPTAKNQFFIQPGDNDDKYGELDFYRECAAQKKTTFISEATAIAEATKLIAICGKKIGRNIDIEINKRMKVVGRLPNDDEAAEIDMDHPHSIVFLRADHSAISELDDDVKGTMKSIDEEVKKTLKFLK